VRNDLGFVVHVDHRCAGINLAGGVMYGAQRRQAGAEVEKLADSEPREVANGAQHEPAMLADRDLDARHCLTESSGGRTVNRVIAGTSHQEIVHAGNPWCLEVNHDQHSGSFRNGESLNWQFGIIG
jgi:hypothetical protein